MLIGWSGGGLSMKCLMRSFATCVSVCRRLLIGTCSTGKCSGTALVCGSAPVCCQPNSVSATPGLSRRSPVIGMASSALRAWFFLASEAAARATSVQPVLLRSRRTSGSRIHHPPQKDILWVWRGDGQSGTRIHVCVDKNVSPKVTTTSTGVYSVPDCHWRVVVVSEVANLFPLLGNAVELQDDLVRHGLVPVCLVRQSEPTVFKQGAQR